jgi:hypothetical protein
LKPIDRSVSYQMIRSEVGTKVLLEKGSQFGLESARA